MRNTIQIKLIEPNIRITRQFAFQPITIGNSVRWLCWVSCLEYYYPNFKVWEKIKFIKRF